MCRPSFLKSPFSENVAVIVSALATVSRTSPSKVSGAGSIIAAFFRTIALNGFRWILENSILAPRFFSRPSKTFFVTKVCTAEVCMRMTMAKSRAAIASTTSQNILKPLLTRSKNSKKNSIFADDKVSLNMSDYILGIESSCDDTSAAVIKDGFLMSNVIASQQVHKDYGGVVPELASRAHEQNIVPVVSQALAKAGIKPTDLTAIAFTRGPGLLGSLLVGTSFAKALGVALNIPIIMVNHLQGHILADFIKQPDKENRHPSFPYLCLLVSGGNSQIVRVDNPLDYEILGQTIDDAVGEAFDKCSKMMGLGYPGGPIIDKLAKSGNPDRFQFAKPQIPGLDYSFSGVKTSLLYFVRDQLKEDPDFMEKNKEDICASFQKTLIDILLSKLIKAAKQTGIREITIGGGVSANSGLRNRIEEEGRNRGWNTYLPEFKFTTDNAAMIAIAGYFHYLHGERTPLDVAPVSRIADF